jgi:hypothetical protein
MGVNSSQDFHLYVCDGGGKVGDFRYESDSFKFYAINSATSVNTLLTTIDSSGNITAVGNVTANSDLSLKDDVTVINNALEKVNALRGVYFTRKDDETKTRKTGVIAQEIQTILPEVVHQDRHGILSVAYGNIVGVLIEAIKDLSNEVDTLKKKVLGNSDL